MLKLKPILFILLAALILGLAGKIIPGAAQNSPAGKEQAARDLIHMTNLSAEEQVVYSDALASGWVNWSWGSTIDTGQTETVHGGSAAIAVKYNAAWGGLYLHTDSSLAAAGEDALKFWINGGAIGGQQVQVRVVDGKDGNKDNGVVIAAPAHAWSEVTVPLNQIGSPATISGIMLQDNTGGAQPVFYVDDIRLALTEQAHTYLPEVSGAAPPAPAPLSVDTAQDRRPISPLIYGMNFTDEHLAAELRLPIRRWGGNSTTRYNYQNDTHNTAKDWYFENIADDNAHPEQLPDGSAADRFIEQNRRMGTDSLITVPLIGWTPKIRPASSNRDCGFRVSKYGVQQQTDPYAADCGNGVAPGGNNLTGNDPADTSIAIGPDFVTGWINYLKSRYGSAANGGVAFYNLDNEPMLWDETHRDVHPSPTTYDELRDRTYQYAAAVKQADPGAKTLGPALWGWCAYLYSAADHCAPGADYQAHNSTYFVEWYLQQMKAYEQQHGVRVLDYLDLHIYPQGQGVFADDAGGASVQSQRLRSTRSLWDANYKDDSWIPEPVNLIPRMRAWVDKNYPGTKLAITEYNWGALGSLNGALAQADILGIFGREGLDLATLWAPPTTSQPGAFAFRMFRNYDGAGSAFGETSVRVSSSINPDNLSIFAALRAKDNALTVMVINKTASSQAYPLSIANFSAANVQVYQYSGENLGAIVRQPDLQVSGGVVNASFPANSITLLVAP